MRVVIVWACLLLVAGYVWARPVSENEAAVVANQFVSAVFGENQSGGVWQYRNTAGAVAAYSCERVLANGRIITVMVGGNTEMPPVLLYYFGEPLEKVSREKCLAVAAGVLDGDVREKGLIYFSPFDFWFEYEADGRNVLVSPRDFRTASPEAVRAAGTVSYPAESRQEFAQLWEKYLSGQPAITSSTKYWINGVPNYDWHYGCAPTAAANVLAYWDSRGFPLLVDSVNYNVYDPVEKDYDSVPNCAGELAEAMNTSPEGLTRGDSIAPGIMLVCNSPAYGNNYGFNSRLEWDKLGLMISEIRNDRPGVLGLLTWPVYGNHAVTFCGYGPPDTNWIMIHDNWGPPPKDTVIYYYTRTEQYKHAVFPVVPGGAPGPDVAVTSILRPEQQIPPGVLWPAAMVSNLGNTTATCSVTCRISRPGGGFYQQFTDTDFPPTGWTVFNQDGGAYTWTRGTESPKSPPSEALCQREAQLTANDDWLISPRVRVREKDTLYFWFRSTGPQMYPESLEVWVSYTEPHPAAFVDCIFAYRFTNSTYQLGWADFSRVGDALVYIGFRYGMRAGLGGTGICLDDIQLKSDYYLDTTVVTLYPGQSEPVLFRTWMATEGHYAVRCSVYLAGDIGPENNVKSDTFLVSSSVAPPGGWAERRPLPTEPSRRQVRDGGSLTYMPGTGLIYATKGNKTADFYSYDPLSNSWRSLPPIQGGASGKFAGKGTRLAADENRYVYMVKGNNTLEFWRYDTDSIAGWRWDSLRSIPLGRGTSKKKIKGGNDLVYVPAVYGDTASLYLLKGYKTDFYRFNIVTGEWQILDSAPVAARKKYQEGSFLVYDGDRTIYCHQSNYYNKYESPPKHCMFRYDIVGDTWYRRMYSGMPVNGKYMGRYKNKKSREGGAGVWYNGYIYALKGGNTGMFFRYNPVTDSWTELDTIPLFGTSEVMRGVKNGGDLVNVGNAFYAFKGNNTSEFWRFALPLFSNERPRPVLSGSQSMPVARADGRLKVYPNPLTSNFACVKYEPLTSGAAVLRVYDLLGRVVLTKSMNLTRSGGTATLDLRGFSCGVYLVRLETGSISATQKLVVQK